MTLDDGSFPAVVHPDGRVQGLAEWARGERLPIEEELPPDIPITMEDDRGFRHPRGTTLTLPVRPRRSHLWLIAAFAFLGAFVGALVAVFLLGGIAHADDGDDDGDCGLVCTQSRLGEDPGQIAQDLHDGDPRYSIWNTTQQVWTGLQDQP